MNFSKKLVPALLGLSLSVGASSAWAAAPVALASSNTSPAFGDVPTIALNTFQSSGDYSLASTAAMGSFVGLGAAPVTFQQVEGSAPLAAARRFGEFSGESAPTNHQGNWRVLLAGLSLIGFLMVRRSAQL